MKFSYSALVLDKVGSYKLEYDQCTVYFLEGINKQIEYRVSNIELKYIRNRFDLQRATYDHLWDKWLDDFVDPANWIAAGKLLKG